MVGWVRQVGVGNVLVREVVGGCFVVSVPRNLRVLWVLEDSVDDVRVVIVKFKGCEGGIVGGRDVDIYRVVDGVDNLANCV